MNVPLDDTSACLDAYFVGIFQRIIELQMIASSSVMHVFYYQGEPLQKGDEARRQKEVGSR